MRFNSKHSYLLLLLLPSLATSLAASPRSTTRREDDSISTYDDEGPTKAQKGIASKAAAPFDDGKPHSGPFVETDGIATDSNAQDLPPLKGRPRDPTMVDGKKIPESNDGVMFDKNRQRPLQGTTGTEGGVSQKALARKAKEGQMGGKVLTQPESPKERPPLPHSEEQKLGTWDGWNKMRSKQPSDKDDANTDYTGLDKPAYLPETGREKTNPLPKSADKDHLETSQDVVTPTRPSGKTRPESVDQEGIVQPFHSFVLSLAMILVSEVGDKTFLVAALMAMKHDRIVVFSAAYGALVVMTILSAVLGHAVPTLIPKKLTSLLAAGLFLVFGVKLLREGMQMDPNEGVSAEMQEVEQELAEKEKELGRRGRGPISAHSLEMGFQGRKPRTKNRFPSPPRSPSQSPSPSRSQSRRRGSVDSLMQGVGNLCSLLLSPAWVQTFAMTFLGEWGDRSQIATIAMAAGQDYWWVTLGALFGHAVCTGVAVLGGRAIAGRVSLKVVTVGGAVAFLFFALLYLIESLRE